MALVHGVSVHDPGHGLFVGIDIGGGDVSLWTDEFSDFGGVAAGDAFELAFAEQLRLTNDAAFAATEGDIDHGTLPGHPGGEGTYFIEGNVGRETNAAFSGAAGDGVLHAIASEHFDAAVIERDRNIYGEFHGGQPQHLADAIIEFE